MPSSTLDLYVRIRTSHSRHIGCTWLHHSLSENMISVFTANPDSAMVDDSWRITALPACVLVLACVSESSKWICNVRFFALLVLWAMTSIACASHTWTVLRHCLFGYVCAATSQSHRLTSPEASHLRIFWSRSNSVFHAWKVVNRRAAIGADLWKSIRVERSMWMWRAITSRALIQGSAVSPPRHIAWRFCRPCHNMLLGFCNVPLYAQRSSHLVYLGLSAAVCNSTVPTAIVSFSYVSHK